MIQAVTLKQQHRATDRYKQALRSGELVPAEVCERCGSRPGLGGIGGHHHNGYDDSHALDVVWLCRSCHRRAHGGTPRPAPGQSLMLLNKTQLAALLGVSRRTVDRMTAAGTAPPSVLLPSGRRRWRKGDVRRWIASHRASG